MVKRQSPGLARRKKLPALTAARGVVVPALVLLFSIAGLRAQYLRDPLTRKEADAVRNTAAQPAKRIDLLVKFTQARLQRFDDLRAHHPDQLDQMHHALSQYDDLVGEIDDNVHHLMSGETTSLMSGPVKLKKPLEALIQAEKQWLAQLEQAARTASPSERQAYRYKLEEASDDTADSLQHAQRNLQQVLAQAKAKRKQDKRG